MSIMEKILCILIPLIISLIISFVLCRREIALKHKTDIKSKIKYAAREEEICKDIGGRITNIKGSLFTVDNDTLNYIIDMKFKNPNLNY